MYGARPLPGEETRPLPYWQKSAKLPNIYINNYSNPSMNTSAAYASSRYLPSIPAISNYNPYPYPYLYPSFLNKNACNNNSTTNHGASSSIFHSVFWGMKTLYDD